MDEGSALYKSIQVLVSNLLDVSDPSRYNFSLQRKAGDHFDQSGAGLVRLDTDGPLPVIVLIFWL